MTVVVWVAAGVLVLGLVVWTGTRMVRTSEGGGGVGNGLGTFVDVFDPARARSDEDLKSKEHQREATPAPRGRRPAGVGRPDRGARAGEAAPRQPGRPRQPGARGLSRSRTACAASAARVSDSAAACASCT
ncbi:hypothetical protein [Nocardioides sp. TF02-7]|uniref:hypothetical protein n=1 Tax=Nocardioides sp. TF02-7 TaxID=2917724 RepID=UPI001F059104|nr:hypothetical protein [Nocardioides sp. TF02-7]UMG93039.1 hypothetical protein MF408_01445 [Nocardioides sp. TF02-7]